MVYASNPDDGSVYRQGNLPKDPFEIDALFDTEWGHTETDPLEKEIAALFAQSRFQEAESLVLKRLSSKQPAALKTALSFYNALNQLPDERLNAHGFPGNASAGGWKN